MLWAGNSNNISKFDPQVPIIDSTNESNIELRSLSEDNNESSVVRGELEGLDGPRRVGESHGRDSEGESVEDEDDEDETVPLIDGQSVGGEIKSESESGSESENVEGDAAMERPHAELGPSAEDREEIYMKVFTNMAKNKLRG
ncbi:hypothetical protein ACEPPN_007790 [Leptodophora sp. 'Broadleaf-Isolate-01']